MLQLKKVLQELSIPQAKVARFCDISEGAFAQIVNHNLWPKKPSEKALRTKVLEFLTPYKAARDTVFQLELECCNTPAPDHKSSQSEEDTDMLLRKQILTPAAKKAFGLLRNPFGELQCKEDMWISPDIRYVREHMYTTARSGGITAVYGESGAGKSSLRRDLEQRIADEHAPIILAQPYMTAAEENDQKGKTVKSIHIARAILRAVAPLEKPCINSDDRFHQLHRALIDAHKSGQHVCLMIEEAHSLNIHTLKHLKRLYEFEIGYTKLLSIILIGQPELKEKLNERNPHIRELVQRCEMVELTPIANADLEQFIDYRSKRAGKAAAELIDASGVAAMCERMVNRTNQSQLYPLAVSNFMVAALNLAATIGVPKVNADIVREVV